MKASDLMIGDWINPTFPMQVYMVAENLLCADKEDEGGFTIWESKFDDPKIVPIPLSDDWLGKLGFELFNPPNAIDSRWILSDKDDFIILSIWEKDKDGKYFCKETDKSVKYVHELQQLVRAFTGETLTIKPQ